MIVKNISKSVIAIFLTVLLASYASADEKDDLAKQSQNPVGNIISLPLEYWHYEGMANDSSADALVLKPVYTLGFGNVTPIMTADWEKPSGEQWTIPLGDDIGKLARFGKQPVDF